MAVSKLGKIESILYLALIEFRVTSDRSFLTIEKSGAVEPILGSSPAVFISLPLSFILVIFLSKYSIFINLSKTYIVLGFLNN